MVHVRARAVARDLRQDASTSRFGVFELLEHQHHGALAHDEAIAAEVERPARFLRFVIPLARGLDLTERAHGQRGDGRLGAAGQHRHRVTALDDLGCLADAVRARRAGADDGVVRAARMRMDGDDSRRHVRDHHRHGERADPLRPPLHESCVALFDLFHAADPRAHDDAYVVGVHLARLEARLRQRLLGCRQRELAVPPDVAGGLAVHVFLGVEALDLAGDLGVEVGGVEMRYPADSRNPFDHVRPDGLDVIADGGDEAHAGHSHTSTVGVGFDVHATEDTDPASEIASSPRGKSGLRVWTQCPTRVQTSLRRSRASCSRSRLAGMSRSAPSSSRSLSRRYRTVCR